MLVVKVPLPRPCPEERQGHQARRIFRPYRNGAGNSKKLQKGESSTGKAHIAEEDEEEAEEETLSTEKRKKKRTQSKKKGKPQGLASATHEGVAYNVSHFELPMASSDDKKRLHDTQEAMCSSSQDTSVILDTECTKPKAMCSRTALHRMKATLHKQTIVILPDASTTFRTDSKH